MKWEFNVPYFRNRALFLKYQLLYGAFTKELIISIVLMIIRLFIL